MNEEKTGRQDLNAIFIATTAEEELILSSTITQAKRRLIRKDPTVALGRVFSTAPILTAPWSVQSEEDVPDEWVKFIRNQVLPWRLVVLEKSLYGSIDFGWAPFELVFLEDGGKIVLNKVKPLLQDITIILQDGETGSFIGFKQDPEVFIYDQKALLISFRVEGTMWYGNALLDNVEAPYDQWIESNNGAKRYDKKVAGSHFVVYYPPGSSLDEDSVEFTNEEMARTILTALESSGSVAIPRNILDQLAELNKENLEATQWKIEILEDRGGRQSSFVARLKYLDILKVRGLIMPERSMMEGTHGTLAEASAHIDLALTNMDFYHAYIMNIINERVVNYLLFANFGVGAVGRVWITPSSLVDARKAYLEKVYITILSRMKGDAEIGAIDLDTTKDLLGVPKVDKVTGTDDDVDPEDEDEDREDEE